MKDPSIEIYTAIETLLSGLTYGGRIWNVYMDIPFNKSLQYIWLKDVYFTEDGTEDYYITDCTITIEVGASGRKQLGNKTAINSIKTQILQLLIKKNLSLSGFVVCYGPILESSVVIPNEVSEKGILNREELRIFMKTQQL